MATSTPRPSPASLEQPGGERRLAVGVDPARRLVEHEQIGLGHGDGGDPEALALPAREIARMTARREREPEPLERGRRAHLVAADPERDLVDRGLAHEIAAGILREVRRAPDRASTVPASARAARRRSSRASSCRCRSRPSSATISPRLNAERDAAEHLRAVAVGEADGVEPDERRADACSAAAVVRLEPARVPRPRHREPRARLRDRRVEDDPSLLHHDHAIGDRERAVDALLGEDDGAPRLLDRGEERLGAVGVELGRRLVEQQELRLERERGGKADALQLPARELDRAPRREMRRADLGRAPRATRGQISSGATPRFSSPNATSFSTRVITTWSSGSWKTDATVPASSAGPCERVSSPPTSTRPGEAAAVEVRHEPRERAQERRLAAAGRAEQRDDLAVLELERDVAHRRHAAGVGEREPLDASLEPQPPPPRAATAPASATWSIHVQAGRGRASPRCARTRAPPSPRPGPSPVRASRRRAARAASRSPARRAARRRGRAPTPRSPAASRSRLGTRRVARATASAERRAKPAAETSRS